MVGLVEQETPTPAPPRDLGFTVSHQKVHLDLDLRSRSLKGRTEITINPQSSDLRVVKLNCRQARFTKFTVGGKAPTFAYVDPYKLAQIPWKANIHQYHMLQERVENQVKDSLEAEPELSITIPKSVKIYELDQSTLLDSTGRITGDPTAADLTQSTKNIVDTSRFTPIIISIEFVIENIRDGLNFAGWEEDNLQYPHVYTGKSSPYSTCCLFPCVDSIDARCTWEISIRTPRTLGDAFSAHHKAPDTQANGDGQANGLDHGIDDGGRRLSDEDRALDLTVVCSGDVTDEIVDVYDSTKKTTSFLCSSTVSAQHIGFAVGPFEHINLAAFRETEEDDKLGGSAIPIHGFCLPGRADDVRNTCLPMAKAMDYIVTTYGRYPFTTYKVCFIDGMKLDRVDTASLSLCSNRLLFPDDILDPMDRVTRELIYGLACQWSGVDMIPKEPGDKWAVVGVAYYITDLFMRRLAGNNENRFHQTKAAERVCDMDIDRPSIYDSGRYVTLDDSHMALISAKAPLVLYILDRRLTKVSGSTGLSRVISRLFLTASVGEMANGALSTAFFQRVCERLGHTKLDTFFNQWVLGAGCPRFRVTQRFNKKRLVVEMQISQVQGEQPGDQDLDKSTFLRDVKEDHKAIYAGNLQTCFQGPMTIRIHEADGTPYEHITEIRDAITRFEVPYSTKYKRLKRTRRHREKVASGLAVDTVAEGTDDSLLYCLGDVLQTPDEEADWRLSNWTKEDEDRMSGESYEWIRMDSDFEWICKMTINMPGYMFVSQLQQDRDVTAQYETIQYLSMQKPLQLISTILVRTLMDTRYFHGIRTAAAVALAKHAKEEVGFIGLYHLKKAFDHLFCFTDSGLTLSNDFSDRAAYYVQCAILRSISQVRDGMQRSPIEARDFLLSKLRENDNSNNEFSDCYYVALLMKGLAEAEASAPMQESDTYMELTDGDDYRFHEKCIEEIDRHRRIDEWIPSYHNVITVAALDCKRLLAQSGIIPRRSVDYLQYTQDGTYDDLRVAAFSNLVRLGFLNDDHVLRWFIFVLGHDPSAYIRAQLYSLFGIFIATAAIGSDKPSGTVGDPDVHHIGGLIIQQETSTQVRTDELARRRTIPGALLALKPELGINETLKTAIWGAILSPALTIPELLNLLEICDLLYEPITSMVLALRYPRYYKAKNLGRIPAGGGKKAQHIVAFTQTKRIRTRPQGPRHPLLIERADSKNTEPRPPVRRESSGGKPARPQLSLKPPKKPSMGPGGIAMPPPSAFSTGGLYSAGGIVQSPGTPVAGTPGLDGKPKLKLKLKIGPGSGGGGGGGGLGSAGPGTPRG